MRRSNQFVNGEGAATTQSPILQPTSIHMEGSMEGSIIIEKEQWGVNDGGSIAIN